MEFNTPMRHLFASDRGQASTEYVIATLVLLTVVAALLWLLGFFAGADGNASSQHSKIYSRAPYTVPRADLGSEQWVKDLIIH